MNRDSCHDRLEQLLKVPAEESRRQRQARFASVSAELTQPVVLWGAGPLGRTVAERLQGSAITVAGFVDRNKDRWGTSFCGLPILGPDDLRTGKWRDALVIITVFTNESVRRLLTEWDRPFLTFPELAWGLPDRFLPYGGMEESKSFAESHEAIRAGLDRWADDASREEYVGQLEWRAALDYTVLPPHLPAATTYFPPEWVKLGPDEHFVDCGAFDGDSIRAFLEVTGGKFRQITGLEPDHANFARLQAFADQFPPDQRAKILVVNKGAGEDDSSALLEETGTQSSKVGVGATEIELTSLDSLLRERPPTYIKMDIEGFEPTALRGARQTIAEHRPILAICLYHVEDHLWSIPAYLHSIAPGYSLHLGRHSDECWEIICYAIPPGRSVSTRL